MTRDANLSGRGADDVATFFAGRSALITGATGFMGKVLVEKLLRECPGLDTLYAVIRHKRGKTPADRLAEYVGSQAFDRLRREGLGGRLERLVAVSGDVSSPGLGLSGDDAALLGARVSVVFHCAANVRFDLTLAEAVSLNTVGTRNVLQFAKTIQRLDAFIHVSTAYCHCEEEVLEERTYMTDANPEKVIDMVQWVNPAALADITPKLIGSLPNTYAYSKGLSEQLVTSFSDQLPIGIARPSIVMPAWQEPMPGWVDNLNGPSGLLVAAAKGVVRSMHCKEHYLADLMPVDIVINSIITLAWKVGRTRPTQPLVVNICESGDNPITWGGMLEMCKKESRVTPSEGAVWYPDGSIKDSRWQHVLCVVFFHFLPAYFIDLMMLLTGNRTFMVRLQRRIQGGLQILHYYTTRKWHFRNDSLKALAAELSPEDRKRFQMDVRTVDWPTYFRNYVSGVRNFVLHEDPDATKAVRHHQRLYVLHRVTVTAFYALLAWLVWSVASSVASSDPSRWFSASLGANPISAPI